MDHLSSGFPLLRFFRFRISGQTFATANATRIVPTPPPHYIRFLKASKSSTLGFSYGRRLL
jgi:hypothetical protein